MAQDLTLPRRSCSQADATKWSGEREQEATVGGVGARGVSSASAWETEAPRGELRPPGPHGSQHRWRCERPREGERQGRPARRGGGQGETPPEPCREDKGEEGAGVVSAGPLSALSSTRLPFRAPLKTDTGEIKGKPSEG